MLREDSAADCWILCERAEDHEPVEQVDANQEVLAPFVDRIVDISPFWPVSDVGVADGWIKEKS